MTSASPAFPGEGQTSAFDLPGYTRLLNYLPVSSGHVDETMTYLNALVTDHVTDSKIDRVFTHRELTMLRVMNKITDTPGWETWMHDGKIVSEWWDKYKVNNQTSSNTSASSATHQGVDQYLFSDIVLPESITDEGSVQRSQHSTEAEEVTTKMKRCMIRELQQRAEHFRGTKAVMVFDAFVKSDTVIPSCLRNDLVSAAHSLEEDQSVRKSEETDSCQVDIVDPNWFPLIYGRSQILPDRRVGLRDCILAAGLGKKLKMCCNDFPDGEWYDEKYQQLPCDCVVSPSGGGCRIVSYINGVHPVHHRSLYLVIEDILTRAIPLLNEALAWHELSLRIDLPEDIADQVDRAGLWGIPEEDPGFCKWEETQGAEFPEPLTIEARDPICGNDMRASLRAKLQERGLQIILRIESIELTPANPKMEAEEWRLEGQPNEHICGTAAYCYDAENVTEQAFTFRQRYDFTDMLENEWHYGDIWLTYVFSLFPHLAGLNVDVEKAATQELGPVLFPVGRLLAFPNVFQRQRSGLSLVDKTKPGHCKTLFLYLVDPHIRIISTANVPPMREDWCENRAALIDSFLRSRVPAEVVAMIEKELGDEMNPPITLVKARKHRKRMISSRERLTERHNYLFENAELPRQ